MLQAKHLILAAAVGSAGWLAGTAVQAEDALEAYRLPAQPALTADIETTEIDPAPPANNFEETSDVAQGEPLECPPGQFPSAFADVYPFHWAYQAINNLASPSMACFDLPEELR